MASLLSSIILLPSIILKQNLCISSSSKSFLNPPTRINPQIWEAVGSRTVYGALFHLDFLSFPPPFFFPFKVMFYETVSCDLKKQTNNFVNLLPLETSQQRHLVNLSVSRTYRDCKCYIPLRSALSGSSGKGF